jgi:DNA-binding NtrC family response regulator
MTKITEGDPSPHKQIVLVVEDEPIIRFSLAMYLEESGFDVREAENAAEAINILQEPGCLVSLVFSDVRMPGEMDGIGLSRWIFENRPNIAVILASGEIGKTTAVQDLCGAEIMPKPFDYGSVNAKIQAAIEKRKPKIG